MMKLCNADYRVRAGSSISFAEGAIFFFFTGREFFFFTRMGLKLITTSS